MKTTEKNVYTYRLVKEELNDIKTAQIKSSKEIYDYIRPFFKDDIHVHESMFLITLNQMNKITGVKLLSIGGITGVPVDVRLVLKYALDSLATGIILAHNHPSGNLKPSDADVRITKKVKEAAKIMEITLFDHLIITDESYTSLADEGLM